MCISACMHVYARTDTKMCINMQQAALWMCMDVYSYVYEHRQQYPAICMRFIGRISLHMHLNAYVYMKYVR